MKTYTIDQILDGMIVTACFGFFPLVSDFDYSHITRSKYIAMLVLTALCVIVSVTKIILNGDRTQCLRLLKNPAVILATAYILWMGLSACFGTSHDLLNSRGEWIVWAGDRRYEGLATALCYFLVFLAFAMSGGSAKVLVLSSGFGILINLGIFVLQHMGKNPLGYYPGERNVFTNPEFQGTIGNVDVMVSYLAVTMPPCIGYFLLKKDRVAGFALISGISGIAILLLIKVQAGYVMLVGLLALLAFQMITGDSRYMKQKIKIQKKKINLKIKKLQA